MKVMACSGLDKTEKKKKKKLGFSGRIHNFWLMIPSSS
jgi:hypothetical protein